MFAQVAQRMGWKDAFSYTRSAEIFREHAALSAFENEHQRVFDIGAFADLDDAAYDALPPTQWPCPRDGSKTTKRRHFAQGGFPTADGRARMISVGGNFDGKRVPGYITLNTGRIRDQWHTMTRTGRVPNLMIHIGKPRLTLHPSDAARLGIEEGGLARVESPHASILVRVTLDRAMRAGDAFMPMHWTDEFTSSGPVNLLVHAVTDPVSGQPDLKGTKIRITKVAEAWRGLLLRRSGAQLCLGPGVHWSKVPVAAGFAFELSGSTPLAALLHSESVLKNLLQVSEAAEIISYADPKREAYRFAGISEGRLEACVIFVPPSADVPAAAEAASQLGSIIGPEARYSLLARPFECTSEIVCACFSVSKETICAMIRTRNLTTPEEIGGTLRAGTNCGSCVPELKKLLADVRLCTAA
jgi:assimilatory nitrate reductase catalytic subunit